MRKWLVLASHDGNGKREDVLDGDPESLERVTYIIAAGDDDRPAQSEIEEAFEGHNEGGEFLFVPLDGDTFAARVQITSRVEVSVKVADAPWRDAA